MASKSFIQSLKYILSEHYSDNRKQFLFRSIYISKLKNRKKGPIDLKGKNTTEQKWLIRQLKDPFVKKARQEDYRCRSCFKLLEIQERYNLLKEGQVVIDVGAAPGSWTQVAVELVLPHLHSSLDPNNTSQTSKIYRTNGEIKIPTFSSIGIDRPILSTTSSKGLVLGIDLQDIQPLQGATFLCNSDITHATTQQNVLKILNGRRADVVLSDVAPQATGVKDLDSDASQELIFNILKFSIQILKQDGHLLIKAFQGRGLNGLIDKSLNKCFEKVQLVKPKASRADSSEVYVLARNFKI